jgi:DNA-binding transcriptional ArsR family regulator
MSTRLRRHDHHPARNAGQRLAIGPEAGANSRQIGLRLAMLTLRLLEHWRLHLGLDRDATLIVLATAAITMEKFVRIGFDLELRDILADMPAERLTKCNVSSIASATGLNRETARRKVRSMREAGVLAVDQDGSIRLSPHYTRSVQTAEMLESQLQTVIQGTNGLLQQGIVEIHP